MPGALRGRPSTAHRLGLARRVEALQAGVVLDGVLSAQAGAVSRSQVLAAGHDDSFVERRLRRRDRARVHRGVYVEHTGPLIWEQRCWAALLLHAPACLTRESALAAYGLRTGSADRDVQVAVDTDRRVTSVPGVRVHRVVRLAEITHPSRVPPCVRLEHALLAVASAAASDTAAIAVLGDACQLRRTTPRRLVDALEAVPRLPRRRLLAEVLDDVAAGAYSALERRYLLRVERPHGLPTAARQRRVRSGRSSAYRDVEYLGTGLVVELDGRLGPRLDRSADPVRPGLLRAGSRRPFGMTCRQLSAEKGRGGPQAQSWPSRRSSASSMVPS